MSKTIEKSGHIEKITVIRDKLILVEGWHSLEDAEFESMRLQNTEGEMVAPIAARRVRRRDVNKSTGLINSELGFQYLFPIEQLTEASANSFKLVFHNGEVGECFALAKKNGIVLSESTSFKVEVGGFEEARFFDLIEAGVQIEGVNGKIEVHVEQVVRHGNVCVLKGWINDEKDAVKVVKVTSESGAELKQSFFRFFRKDIQSYNQLSSGGYRFGFVLVLEMGSEVQSSVKLAAYKNGFVLDKDVSVPNTEVDYDVIVSAIISCQICDAEIHSSASYQEALSSAFEIQKSVSARVIRSSEAETDYRDLAIVINCTTVRLLDVYKFMSNSEFSSRPGVRLYIAIKHEQYTVDAEKLIKKIQYLYDTPVVLLVYPSRISNYKLVKDAANVCAELHVVFASCHSALRLPSKVGEVNAPIVSQAFLYDSAGELVAEGMDRHGNLVSQSDLADGEKIFPLFFGTVFNLQEIQPYLGELAHTSLTRFMAAVAQGGRTASDTNSRYVALDTFDKPYSQTDILDLNSTEFLSCRASENLIITGVAV